MISTSKKAKNTEDTLGTDAESNTNNCTEGQRNVTRQNPVLIVVAVFSLLSFITIIILIVVVAFKIGPQGNLSQIPSYIM